MQGRRVINRLPSCGTIVAKLMAPAQISKAQRLARDWKARLARDWMEKHRKEM